MRRDDERMPLTVKLADPTRLLWDRHCLLAEVDRLASLVSEQAAALAVARENVKRLRFQVEHLTEHEQDLIRQRAEQAAALARVEQLANDAAPTGGYVKPRAILAALAGEQPEPAYPCGHESVERGCGGCDL